MDAEGTHAAELWRREFSRAHALVERNARRFALAVGLVLMPVVFSALAYLLPPIKSALVMTEEEPAPASGDGNSPRKPTNTNSTVPPAF